jgi:hypothetical protein
MEKENQLIITPRTKLLQLFDAYPGLEEVLAGYVPVYKKLVNPKLRNTVAGIVTLQQIAAIGKVKVEDLINRLRKETGQDLIIDNKTENQEMTHKPEWYDEALVAQELDAKNMLAAGEHPVNQVMADLKAMDNNKIYKLTAPFLPAPLIDKALSLGVEHWVEKVNETDYNIYFYKN